MDESGTADVNAAAQMGHRLAVVECLLVRIIQSSPVPMGLFEDDTLFLLSDVALSTGELRVLEDLVPDKFHPEQPSR